MRRIILVAVLLALSVLPAGPAFSADLDADFVPGQERVITKESGAYICSRDPRSPACALETLFSCAVRGDFDVCVSVGVAANSNCQMPGVNGARYAIEAVYGIDAPNAWPSILAPVTDRHRYARIMFRVGFCDSRHGCYEPDVARYEEVEKVGAKWRLRKSHASNWDVNAFIYEQLCSELGRHY